MDLKNLSSPGPMTLGKISDLSDHLSRMERQNLGRLPEFGRSSSICDLHDQLMRYESSLDYLVRMAKETHSMRLAAMDIAGSFGRDDGFLRSIGSFPLPAAAMVEINIKKSAFEVFALGMNDSLFRLATPYDLASLGNVAAERFAGLRGLSVSVQDAITNIGAGVSAPWIDKSWVDESISAMSNLAVLGHAVRFAPFEMPTTRIVQSTLGIWDGSLTAHQMEDMERRNLLYAEWGFDQSILAIPEPAFGQALYSVGLLHSHVAQAPEESAEDELLENCDEYINRKRRNSAYALLEELEQTLRFFIGQQMRLNFGSCWEQTQTPQAKDGKCLASLWEEKKQKAVAHGRPINEPLIDYADFTDYKAVMIRKDNWDKVFSKTFKNKHHLEFAFDQMFPIRLDIAHSRPITKGSFLIFVAHAKHILSAMRKAAQ